MYHSKSRRQRAAEYRAAGRECAAAGFDDFAAVNFAMADGLDPRPTELAARAPRDRAPREVSRVAPVPPKNPITRRLGGNPLKVNNTRDAAPRRRAA